MELKKGVSENGSVSAGPYSRLDRRHVKELRREVGAPL